MVLGSEFASIVNVGRLAFMDLGACGVKSLRRRSQGTVPLLCGAAPVPGSGRAHGQIRGYPY